MRKTRLMTAVAVLSLSFAGAGLAHAQESAPTQDQAAQAPAMTTEAAPADTAQPTRTRQEANRMSRAEANAITADLNRSQLEGLPAIASTGDQGLRTTDDNSTNAGSTAMPDQTTATGEAVTPDTTVPEAGTPDSVPPQAQTPTQTPILPNTQPDDTGKTGSNSNPTDAPDSPVQ